MLRFVAGKRLALGRLTVVDATNVQPEARKPLVELARQYHCLPVAIVLEPARAGLPGAEPRPARPGLRPARRPQPGVATAAVAAGAPQGGVPARLRPGDPRGGRGGDRRAGAAVERPARTSTARSTSSATFTAAATSWRRCSGGWATREAVARTATSRPGATGPTPTPRAARRSSSATWWTVARASSTRCGWCGTWSVHGSALCVPGNHDMKLVRKLAGQERPDHARAGRHAGRDRRPARRACGPRSARNSPSSSTAW